MIYFFYFLAALQIYLSWKSFRGGINYLNYFRREMAKLRSGYTPFATIIAPCRGADDGLRQNLGALLIQDYPSYEVIFVVDDENDAAVNEIRALGGNAKLIIAQKAVESSQKIENLREAIMHAAPESKVFVFVDSDARPSREWLRQLAAPLEDSGVGVATGYRWFISSRPTLASEMRSAWNASIASSLGAGPNNAFCWGGSTAIRRETFERLAVREAWQGTVSDDFVLARLVCKTGLSIYFVPRALTASLENCTFGDLLEFTTRQIKLTRVYAPNLWRLTFFGAGLFNVVMVTALVITISSARSNLAYAAAIFTIVSISLLSVAKAWVRLKAVRIVLKDHERSIRKQTFSQLTLWAATPALFFWNCIASAVSRRIKWRGIEYELVSPVKTVLGPKRLR